MLFAFMILFFNHGVHLCQLTSRYMEPCWLFGKIFLTHKTL
jgi:hypothetical protein